MPRKRKPTIKSQAAQHTINVVELVLGGLLAAIIFKAMSKKGEE